MTASHPPFDINITDSPSGHGAGALQLATPLHNRASTCCVDDTTYFFIAMQPLSTLSPVLLQPPKQDHLHDGAFASSDVASSHSLTLL
jgi:hypothetical protein